MNVRRETEIQAAHEHTRQTYGTDRLGHTRGLRCKQKCTFIATTDSAHTLPVAKNVLNREFTIAAPNNAWVTDITYIATDEGWLSRCGFKYLAGVKDVFNGEFWWAMPWPSP